MKTKFLLALLIVSCLSFTPGTAPQWEGHWIENWGVGQETDIDYHDRYTISKDELFNTTGYDTMPYHLVMEPDNNKMTGYAYSVHGRKMNIEWLREEE